MGLEPIGPGGHSGNIEGPDQAQVDAPGQLKLWPEAQTGSDGGHPVDTCTDAPCCAGVAQPVLPTDLERLAVLWADLPEATRAAILTLAEGTRR